MGDLWPVACVPLVALVGFLTGAVDKRGAVAGLAVGLAIAWGAGWRGFFMLAALLAVGTLCSRGSSRDRGWVQVLCNGAVAALAALVSWPLAVAGARAAALSDTGSGELGRRRGGRPRLLLFGRAVDAGRDGGMSAVGTLLGLPAAAMVALAGSFDDLRIAAVITVAGFGGNVIDSVLGATVQARLGKHGNDLVNLMATAAGAAIAVLLGAGTA